jgi:hypothetical protein
VLDVEVEAKRLLEQFLPKGRGAVVEAYRTIRAELGRRPTPTELFHAGYLPQTLQADYGNWFNFCTAEEDLTTDEKEVVKTYPNWFDTVQTTKVTKSFKMEVLRVLLDHDTVWDGMDIGELATACRRFLVSHPGLRADLDDTPFAVPPAAAGFQPAESVPDPAFTSYWLGTPLDRWLNPKFGRRWFVRRGDRFVANFKIAAEYRPVFESLTGELVDFRLAHYT